MRSAKAHGPRIVPPVHHQRPLQRELAYNIRGAGRLIDDQAKEVWEILEEVIKDKYVLLNRAPTLHRLGIQAFKPILIEGNAIQVHPLVCTAFNADFDGDQMAVHVPLGIEAQAEAREIMASDKNILKPGNGDPTIISKLLDIVLGCFWITKTVERGTGEGKIFESPEAAVSHEIMASSDYRSKIKVMPDDSQKYAQFEGKLFETTVGRILFNNILPADYPFINKEINQDKLSQHHRRPHHCARRRRDSCRSSTRSRISASITPRIPARHGASTTSSSRKARTKSSAKQRSRARSSASNIDEGLLTEEERIRKNIELWHKAKSDIEKLIPGSLDKMGPVYDMITSGARGSLSQIAQMAGMKGLIASTSGEIIEFPILSCSKEGLTPIEYFITTHGARKGLTDTALNTAKAGYLTRKLFVVAQDVMVSEDDCGTKESIIIKKQSASGIEIPLSKNIRGRVLAEDIASTDGKVMFKKGHLLSKGEAQAVEAAGITAVHVRSPLSCKTIRGVCAQCYGLDLGKNEMIALGEAVGTVAAQAIGEPGTQLTMRTFHSGGAASAAGDITAGLPRVEEIFEKRSPRNPAVVATVDGMVSEIRDMNKGESLVVIPDIEHIAPTKSKSKKKTSRMERPKQSNIISTIAARRLSKSATR